MEPPRPPGNRRGPVAVRGDVSGWCITETGAPGSLDRTPSGQWQVTLDGYEGTLQAPSFETGGSICELRTSAWWQPGIAETAAQSDFDGFPLFSTNQIYLRVSALQRVFGLTPDADPVGATCRFVESQPFYAERKIVNQENTQKEAMQLSQGANGVLREMAVIPARISRRQSGAKGSVARTAHAVLKRPEDIVFAQLILDELALEGDDLVFG